jgi:chromosome segregation protein
MIIRKLELQGFKSFPERTKIVFHPGITTIVGPNGTGKSNIVDALLWVLGGKRLRSLGAERSGTLIFNGNTKRAPLNMADVTLSLSDDEEELKINHRFFRTSESEYRLNGKVVRLKDIHDSLWKRSIGEKEYFVIEQGSIGLFLSSKPLEKRALLEEAAGTAYYKDKKRQAQNKLENSEQNLTRLEDIIAEVARAKNSLKRQAHAAVRFRKLREDIRKLTSFHFHKKIKELEKSQESIQLSYTESMKTEEGALALLKAEEKNLSVKRKEYLDLEQSIMSEREDFFSLRSLITRSETDKEKEAKNREFNADWKKKSSQRKQELRQELLSIEKEQSKAEANLKELRESFQQETQSLNNEGKKDQSLEKKLAEKKDKIGALRDEYLVMLSEITETENERVKLEKDVELILRQKDKLNLQLKEQRTLLSQMEKERKKIADETIHETTAFTKKQRDIEAAQSELDMTRSDIQNTQSQRAELSEKKNRLVHQLSAIEKLEKAERGTDSPQNMQGAIGLLADLIKTDEKHAPLVDVLWKEETKAALIPTQDFLKHLAKDGLKGRVFLLHPQEKRPSLSKVYDDPRVIGRLRAHVHPDKTIKDHLSRLNDAAIVNDLMTAVNLWIRNPSINYVTAAGEVLYSSGLVKSGRKQEGLLTLSQEKKSLEKKIERLDEKMLPLDRLTEEKKKHEEELEEKIERETTLNKQNEKKIEELKKDESYLKTQKEKIATDISIIEREIEVLGRDEKGQDQKMKDLSLRKEELEAQERNLKQMSEKEEKELSDMRENKEHGRTQYFEIKSGIDILQEKIQNTETQIQAMMTRNKAISTNIASLEKELLLSDEKDKKTGENIQRLSVEIRKLKKDVEQKKSLLAQRESLLKEVSAENETLEKRVEELRQGHEGRKEEKVKWEIKKAEIERDRINLEESCWQELKKTLKEVKEEILPKTLTEEDIEISLDEAKEKLQRIRDVNLMAEEEYLSHKERYDFLVQQKKDLEESILATREAIHKIDKESKSQFTKAFHEVNKHFQEVFSLLFKGGQAEIRFSDPSHPLESGVEITAQPPGKKVQSLSLLSGGEKSLTSLAFFFALFRYKPTPFCILDEVDAALDEANLARFLELMKKIKKQTQFIIVTHNFKTMEVADYIYGTTMAEPNITNLYAMKLEARKGGRGR